MGGLGVSFGGKASVVEETKISGASSTQRMQAQETDGSRGSGESDAFPNPEPCGTRLWGAGQTSGKADCTGHWSGPGQSQDWIEESGLQFGSILCVGGDISAPSRSTG